jgi:hypothetical protein
LSIVLLFMVEAENVSDPPPIEPPPPPQHTHTHNSLRFILNKLSDVFLTIFCLSGAETYLSL